jgi:N-acetylglucosamine-6-sulfatase
MSIGTRQRVSIAAVASAALLALAPGAEAARERSTNVVVIVTDDQELGSLSKRTMPNVLGKIARRGTSFTDFVVSGPLCCPARAVNLTGQYGHNNGVLWNHASNPGSAEGGYGSLRSKHQTLPVWLREEGYRTVHIGRYLNLYQRWVSDPSEVAPGWTDWHTVHEPYGYYRYTLHRNGRSVPYHSRRRDHLTRVLNEIATKTVRTHRFGRQPLFMAVDHLVPHAGQPPSRECGTNPTPIARDIGTFRREPLPQPPSFNEDDVSDKPPFIADRPQLGHEEVAEVRTTYRCRLESLIGVDRGVRQLFKALRKRNQLRNTAILFTSDNGWFSGQHRIPASKVIPYEEALRVPMLLRLPGSMRDRRTPRRVTAPAANIDIVPTVLDLAGARPCVRGECRRLDGRSLLPLARGRGRGFDPERPILLELDNPGSRAAPLSTCSYAGVRRGGFVYIEHRETSGPLRPADCAGPSFSELYDLRRDPHQLENLSTSAGGGLRSTLEADLARTLARLRDCSGSAASERPLADRPRCP